MSIPPAAELAGACREVICGWHRHEPPLDWTVVTEALSPRGDSWLDAMAQLCLVNCFQWHLEDECRAQYANADRLAALKREIDASNRRRVDCIDALDERIARELAQTDGSGSEPVAVITPGNLMDRISILELKRAHAGRRADVTGILCEEIEDACCGLDRLVADLARTRQRLKRYRTVKLYGAVE